jgi:cell division protein FtsB
MGIYRTLTDEELRRRLDCGECPDQFLVIEAAGRFLGNESDAERIEELEKENDDLEQQAHRTVSDTEHNEVCEERDALNIENDKLTETVTALEKDCDDLQSQVDALTAAFAAYIT